jgi:hypothetical protein
LQQLQRTLQDLAQLPDSVRENLHPAVRHALALLAPPPTTRGPVSFASRPSSAAPAAPDSVHVPTKTLGPRPVSTSIVAPNAASTVTAMIATPTAAPTVNRTVVTPTVALVIAPATTSAPMGAPRPTPTIMSRPRPRPKLPTNPSTSVPAPPTTKPVTRSGVGTTNTLSKPQPPVMEPFDDDSYLSDAPSVTTSNPPVLSDDEGRQTTHADVKGTEFAETTKRNTRSTTGATVSQEKKPCGTGRGTGRGAGRGTPVNAVTAHVAPGSGRGAGGGKKGRGGWGAGTSGSTAAKGSQVRGRSKALVDVSVLLPQFLRIIVYRCICP